MHLRPLHADATNPEVKVGHIRGKEESTDMKSFRKKPILHRLLTIEDFMSFHTQT